jgi:hypothetical protein
MMARNGNVYALITILEDMVSIPTPPKTRLRDRIFFLPNLVLWLMSWLLVLLSDLEYMDLVIPFYVSFLVMSGFVVYDTMSSGRLVKAMELISDSGFNRRLLMVLFLAIVPVVLWLVGMYYDTPSWLIWNSVAAASLAYSYVIVLDSSD